MTTVLYKARFFSSQGHAWGYVRQDKDGLITASIAFEKPGSPDLLGTPVWQWDGRSNNRKNARRAMLRAAHGMNLSRTTLDAGLTG